MATATLPIPKARQHNSDNSKCWRIGRQSPPAVTGDFVLRLNDSLAMSLEEMADLANANVGPYITDLITAGVAEFRARKIPAGFLDLDNTEAPVVAANANSHHNKISPEDKERMIEQRDGGMSVKDIARRWGIGQTTVRRALDCD